jgi:hypothetical protein
MNTIAASSLASVAAEVAVLSDSRANAELIFKLYTFLVDLLGSMTSGQLAEDCSSLSGLLGVGRSLGRSPLGLPGALAGLRSLADPERRVIGVTSVVGVVYLAIDHWLFLKRAIPRLPPTSPGAVTTAVRGIYAAWFSLVVLNLLGRAKELSEVERQLDGASELDQGQCALLIERRALLKRAILRYLIDVPLALLPALAHPRLQLSPRNKALIGVASGVLGLEVIWSSRRLSQRAR